MNNVIRGVFGSAQPAVPACRTWDGMSVAEAQLFLIRNSKAEAIANKRWAEIQGKWELAFSIVEGEKNRFRTITQDRQPVVVKSEASKQRTAKAMKKVAKVRMVKGLPIGGPQHKSRKGVQRRHQGWRELVAGKVDRLPENAVQLEEALHRARFVDENLSAYDTDEAIAVAGVAKKADVRVLSQQNPTVKKGKR